MYYSFKRDLADGKRGEAIVKTYLEMGGAGLVTELPKKDKNGDLALWPATCMGARQATTYEVKYDLMSKRTGNMCFEVANGKGEPTGIALTQADMVAYVVPTEDSHVLYLFSRPELYDWLFNKGINHRIVNGGDKKKFSMILVSLNNIDELCTSTDWCTKVVLNA